MSKFLWATVGAGEAGRLLVLAAAVVLLGGAASPALASSEEEDAAASLAAVWKAFEEAKEYEKGVDVLESFKSLAASRSGHLPTQLWTAYVHTQMARWALMESKEGGAAYLDGAQAHLDKALALPDAGSDQASASLHALQALIYSFRVGSSGEVPQGEEDPYQVRQEEALQEAVRIDPQNPVVEIFVATNLIAEAGREKDLGKVIAGRALLAKAEASLGDAAGDRTATPFWNVDWLGYWSSHADQILETVKKRKTEAQQKAPGAEG